MNTHFFSTALLCTLCTITAAAEIPVWKTDLPAALQQAKQEDKLVLIDFTGSDWCTSCIALRRTILDNPEFLEWAQEKFVFMEVDIPQRKKLPAGMAERNKAIAKQYDVKGFPTIMVLTPQGRVVGGFLGNVDSVKTAVGYLENARTAAAAFDKAELLQGKEKAEMLMNAYRVYPTGKAFDKPRHELRESIRSLDPHNSTGIHADAAVREQAERFAAERAATPPRTEAYGKLIDQQLAQALPANKADIFMEKCQHSLSMANSIEDLKHTKLLFEELISYQTPEAAAETREFLDRFFTDLPALLNMLNNSRPR